MIDIGALQGLRPLIVGLGREGMALATYLNRHGLAVTATDQKREAQLKPVSDQLRAAGVSLVLGEHPLSLLDETDLLFVSPGVPLESPFVAAAQERMLPLCTESKLFCSLCPAPIVGITGSSGKTTTTTLVGKILDADGQKCWVGGNIGRPLIEVLDQIKPEDKVVMELSSFQLEYFHAALNEYLAFERLPDPLARLLGDWSPPIAALLNVTPNHLDRHPSMKQYVQAKRAIIDYQTAGDAAVMSLDNDITRTIGHQFPARVRWFSLEAQPPGGAGLADETVTLFDAEGTAQPVAHKNDIKLRGNHNLSNILAACLLAREAGASIEAMQQVVTSFTGVEHRLQLVRQLDGVAYYNDSIATTPERVIAALRSFDEPVVLLAGGRDKNLPWEEAARLILSTVRHAILFGEAAGIIAGAIKHLKGHGFRGQTELHRRQSLAEAVQKAAELAQPGEVVLLSPGCASYDAFTNYMERGDRFRDLVLELPERS